MFWERSHLQLRDISILCVILISVHRTGFIHFSLLVGTRIPKWTHLKTEENRSFTLGPRHLNPYSVYETKFSTTILLSSLKVR